MSLHKIHRCPLQPLGETLSALQISGGTLAEAVDRKDSFVGHCRPPVWIFWILYTYLEAARSHMELENWLRAVFDMDSSEMRFEVQ